MISFNQLGNYGRFGNQLFQYAFLRSQAKRLHTKFYCPPWEGDDVFVLGDISERTTPFKAQYTYSEGDFMHGFNTAALEIKDNTEIGGYFQSDKFFVEKDVRSWFQFDEEKFSELKKKYEYIDFANSTAIHLRLGDYLNLSLQFYVAKKTYFKKALDIVSHKKHILVFSDQPDLARIYLKGIQGNVLFVEGNAGYEDFYLMSKCRDIICSASSFSWWAAYLNPFQDKKVVVPASWFLPGSRTINNDIFVKNWIRINAHKFYDHYYVRAIPVKLLSIYKKFFNFSVCSSIS